MSLGYFKVWRQLENSDLWMTDPLTLKIWLWILMHACHQELRLPNITLQPGELLTTYADIMKAMVVPGHGFRKKYAPSLQTVRTSMQALCALYVIAKQQAPQQGGLHIKVLQWDKFQGTNGVAPTGYVTDISTDLQQTSNTIQECKEGKAFKKEPKTLVQAAPKNGGPPDGFDEWWRVWPKKVDKGHAVRAYKAALRKASADEILRGLESQVNALRSRDVNFIPLPATWLNGERWADESGVTVVTERAKVVSNLRAMLADGREEIMVRGICEAYEERGDHEALWQEVCAS